MKNKVLLPILTTFIVLLIGLGLFAGYKIYVNNQIEKGYKEITVKVIAKTDDDNYEKTYKFWTKAEFLYEALNDNIDINVEDSSFGKYLVGVDGINAESTKSEWWKINYNGEMASVGMEMLVIKHEDVIELVLDNY